MRQYAAYMLFGIDEGEHQRQLAAGIHQAGCLDPATASESRYRMQNGGSGNLLLVQVVEHLQMHRAAMPLVGLIEIDRDLHRFSGVDHRVESSFSERNSTRL